MLELDEMLGLEPRNDKVASSPASKLRETCHAAPDLQLCRTFLQAPQLLLVYVPLQRANSSNHWLPPSVSPALGVVAAFWNCDLYHLSVLFSGTFSVPSYDCYTLLIMIYFKLFLLQ